MSEKTHVVPIDEGDVTAEAIVFHFDDGRTIRFEDRCGSNPPQFKTMIEDNNE